MVGVGDRTGENGVKEKVRDIMCIILYNIVRWSLKPLQIRRFNALNN